MLRPMAAPISGSLPGPKMIRAITRITASSIGPMPKKFMLCSSITPGPSRL